MRKTIAPFLFFVFILSCACDMNPPSADDSPEQEYTCKIAWQVPAQRRMYAGLEKLYGNFLYFISGDKSEGIPETIFKIDLDAGVKCWETPDLDIYLNDVAKVGNVVYVVAGGNYMNGGRIYCFDDSTGEHIATVWLDANGEKGSELQVWLGTMIPYDRFLIWGAGTGLYKFDTALVDFNKPPTEVQIVPPECLFPVPPNTGVACTPFIEENTVYFMRCAYMDEPGENDIVAFDLTNNTVLWKRKSDKMTGLVIDGLLIDGDHLLVVDAYGSACLNKADGTTVWVHNIDNDNGLLSGDPYGKGLFLYDGKLYFTQGAHSDTYLYLGIPKEDVFNIICLNASTGVPVWTDMPPGVCGSLGARPVVANGKAYIAHEDGLRIYNANTGKLLGVDRRITPSGRNSSSQYYNDMVIVNSRDADGVNSTVFAIRAE